MSTTQRFAAPVMRLIRSFTNIIVFLRGQKNQPGLSLRWRLMIGVATGLIVWLIHLGPAGRTFENMGYDLLFRLRGPSPLPDDLVIVAVDDRSFVDLGRQWPWPRSLHGRLVDRLRTAGARAIAFDILFDQPSTASEDTALKEAIARAGNVVLAADLRVIETASVRQMLHVAPLPDLEKASVGVGVVNLLLDPDKVIRRAQLAHGEHSTFATTIARSLGWTERAFKPTFLVNYLGPSPAFTTVSYSQALSAEETPDRLFKQKIVVIGRSAGAPGRPVDDSHFIPFGKGGLQTPGVEIHAAILDTLLRQQPIHALAPPQIFVWFMIWCVMASLLLGRLLPWTGFAALLVLIASELGCSLTAFAGSNLWLPWASPALGMGGVYVGMVGIRWRQAEQQKRFIRNAFQYYLHPKVVQDILENPARLRLGGDSVVSTILFSDLQGFTQVAEGFTPSALVAFLNEYFSEMTDIILLNRGMLNKTMGDGILALWGVPVKDDDQALAACRAGLAMQRRLAELNIEWAKRGYPPLRMRIGIQTGEVVVGNIGSAQRFDYTPIGDNVNLASRLEGINKLYKTGIILGEETARRVAGTLVLRELDKIRVVGRHEPQVIEECLGEHGTLSQAQLSGFENFNNGLRLYRERDWCKALENFEQALAMIPDDGPSGVYVERCRYFIAQPPPADWDGVYSALGKEG